jgi:acetyl esterase/lipase
MHRKIILLGAVAALLILASCSKSDNTTVIVNIAAKTMLDTSYGVDPKQKMDIYLPANRSAGSTKVIILIHGGGWTSGDKSDFTSGGVIDTLKSRLPDYAIFNINYRLAALPATNTFPTQEIDTKAAVDFIYGNRSYYQISDKFVLLGTSAGGHLALLEAYKYHSPVNIKAVVDFYGPADMSEMYNNPSPGYPALAISALFNYTTPATNPTGYQQSSPVFYVNSTSCPTIILQGALDILVDPTRQSLALKNKLTTATVTNEYDLYPLVGHGPWDVATTTDAINKVQAFLTANVH